MSLKVEQGDAARLLERMMPQIEAQLAASMAMPVEFDVIQEDRLGADGEDLYEADTEDQPGQDHQEQADDDGLVEQWTQRLEEPVLDLGQTTWWRRLPIDNSVTFVTARESSTRWRAEGSRSRSLPQALVAQTTPDPLEPMEDVEFPANHSVFQTRAGDEDETTRRPLDGDWQEPSQAINMVG